MNELLNKKKCPLCGGTILKNPQLCPFAIDSYDVEWTCINCGAKYTADVKFVSGKPVVINSRSVVLDEYFSGRNVLGEIYRR